MSNSSRKGLGKEAEQDREKNGAKNFMGPVATHLFRDYMIRTCTLIRELCGSETQTLSRP